MFCRCTEMQTNEWEVLGLPYVVVIYGHKHNPRHKSAQGPESGRSDRTCKKCSPANLRTIQEGCKASGPRIQEEVVPVL